MSRTDAIWALGAMSGTSLDGVDAAMVLTDGVAVYAFGPTAYRRYSENERGILKAALGRTSGAEIEAAEKVVELAHVELLAGFEGAALIGIHGQTTHHDPKALETCQIGNGMVMAKALETPVVWDFRSMDVRLGGQGAPLAPFYHFALARYAQLEKPVVFLNIGGVANVTWLDPSASGPEVPGACLAFDTGPGNALIDDFCMTRLGQPMDRDGALALAGEVQMDRLATMLAEREFFAKPPPKSLDRNDFADWLSFAEGLSDKDAVATLTGGTATAIACAMDHCPKPPARILVGGGGRRNPALMEMIAGLVDVAVDPVEDIGLDGDMLEAQAFAYLAVRVKRGMPTSAPGTTGVGAPVGGGILSEPGDIDD